MSARPDPSPLFPGFRLIDEMYAGEGASFVVEVEPTCPFFDGHFPGRPVLPAVAQLALLRDLALRIRPGLATIDRIDRLRLSAPVLPGDRLTVRLDAAGDDRCCRFSIRRGEMEISAGNLGWAREERS